MLTIDERNQIIETLKAQGCDQARIDHLLPIIEEAKAIKERNDQNNSWVSSEELRQLLFEKYGIQ